MQWRPSGFNIIYGLIFEIGGFHFHEIIFLRSVGVPVDILAHMALSLGERRLELLGLLFLMIFFFDGREYFRARDGSILEERLSRTEYVFSWGIRWAGHLYITHSTYL